MQIKVECREDSKYEEESTVDSLTYDCKTAAFEMQAAGYIIPSNHPFGPLRLYGRSTMLLVTFEKLEEARGFSEWLKAAAMEAQSSFDCMFEY